MSGKLKLALAIALAVVAGVVGYTQLFRAHPAQSTVKQVFERVEAGDVDGVMENVDPEGQLGTVWNGNIDGARDKLLSFLDRYRLEFNGLKLGTRAEGNYAEVKLKGGRLTVYSRQENGLPSAVLDLGESDLVFEMEKKGEKWLVEAINYDITRLLSGELPF